MSRSERSTALQKLLIVCDGGPSIGFGHLVRSRAIADTAHRNGIETTLIGPKRHYSNEQDATRFAEWLEYPEMGSDGWESWTRAVMHVADSKGIRHVIIDDYRVPGDQQSMLREHGLRILHQYDASAPPSFAADLAVNASPAENASHHTGRLLRHDVHFLNGPRFAVIRRAFAATALSPIERPVRQILVTFGGGDDRGGILFSIASLAPELRLRPETRLVVMTSAQNPNVPAIKSLIEEHRLSNVDIELDHADVPALMASCDLAVMAGGTSVYEAAFCGLPMILIAIASNQEGQCKGWNGLGAAHYLGNIKELQQRHLLNCTLSLLDDRDARMNMARAGRDNVDLRGATRLLEALFERELEFEVIR